MATAEGVPFSHRLASTHEVDAVERTGTAPWKPMGRIMGGRSVFGLVARFFPLIRPLGIERYGWRSASRTFRVAEQATERR